jgi:hypothetical protein
MSLSDSFFFKLHKRTWFISQQEKLPIGFFMITIIVAGKVGSEAAFNILKERISGVVLIDLNQELAQGEALDMMQAAPAIVQTMVLKNIASM